MAAYLGQREHSDVAVIHPTVYLHIGTHKSGTTSIQDVLWHNRWPLASDGILFPGSRGWVEQATAVRDALDMAKNGYEAPDSVGAWAQLARECREWRGCSVIISMEFLSMASPEQAQRIVTSLAPAEVQIVLTARDLARILPAAWQTFIRNGHTCAWNDFLDAAAEIESHDQSPVREFWRQQDLVDILARWESAVPTERMHVVTVPPSDTAPSVLMERFCAVTGLDVSRYDIERPRSNRSLGAASVELLRRINPTLQEKMSQRAYRSTVTVYLAKRVLAERSGEQVIALDRRHVWVNEQARRMIKGIRVGRYPVVGDLTDLEPVVEAGAQTAAPDAVPEGQVLSAAGDAVVGLLQKVSAMEKRARSLRAERDRLGEKRDRIARDLAEFQAERNRLARVVQERETLPTVEFLKRTVVELGARSTLVAKMLALYRLVARR